MYENVSFYNFVDAFRDCGRENQFSYEGKRALFDYLEELEDSIGDQIELDVIAICCEFTEYSSIEELTDACGLDIKDYTQNGEIDEGAVFDEIERLTTVVSRDCFLIQNF